MHTPPSLRSPGDSKTIPLRNSPKLTALMNNVARFCAAIHVSTFGSGWGPYQLGRNVGIQQESPHSKYRPRPEAH
jgi:hypothetical protein